MLNAAHIVFLHDRATAHWHDSSAPLQGSQHPFENLVLEQHHTNFDLWHREDAARDTIATDQAIANVKHAIDALNQCRNDLVERIDLTLLEAAPNQPPEAPLHSETPGLMIDRLSILALKIFHTREETQRADATAEHHRRNQERLVLLLEQRGDLADCLAELWAEVLAGKRRFKLYRQLKMYNDPALNPVLYGRPRNANS